MVGGLLAVGGVVLAFVGTAELSRFLRVRAGGADLLGLARDAGLTLTATRRDHRVHARHEGLDVWLGPRAEGGGTRLEIRPIAPALAAWRVVGIETRLAGVETGDPDFDATVRFDGPALLVRALLDAETRAVALEAFLADSSVAVKNGVLTADFGSAWGPGQVVSPDRIRRLVAIGARLQAPADPVPRLAEIARTDAGHVVRRSAIAVLSGHAAQHPATREAQRAACADADPSVRLAGARHLGSGGVSVLEELATASDVPDDVAAQAIALLGARLGLEALRAIVADAVPARPLSACAALELMGDRGAEAAPAIAAALERAAAGPVALAAVQAIARTKAPSQLPALAAALGSDAAVAFAAAEALARVGTVDCVTALRAAEGRRELARVAREAVAAIQARVRGASPGQLALAAPEDGRLSVAGGDGALTFPLPEERDGS